MPSYSPPWAPHVVGEYTERAFDPEARVFEEQRIRITCGKCGAVHQLTCNSGMVRNHVANFGLAHAHRDGFDPVEAPTKK